MSSTSGQVGSAPGYSDGNGDESDVADCVVEGEVEEEAEDIDVELAVASDVD